ncbi:uncharacterized protein LOC119376731 isoform X2 [Rhipicephalus sanguineus]|uniref:uncharacterized protein LOC119376731 isoform X2 n=2 Tax=Rhipicephalus sanguineus TaxID=34632 RepID=UPI0018960CD9|nr:uncharacterized protein LOC119376731 isoform X2 [Rhipicephalus sanguineus]
MSVCWRDGCEGATNATDKAECLVSLGESKKVVQLTGARKEADLRTSLLQGHFANLTCERFLIQIYNARFGCFVDLDDETEIEDGARINLIICKNAEHQLAEEQMSILLEDVQQVFTVPDSAKHMEDYTLPQVPVDIAAQVKTVKNGNVPEMLRRRIIDWLTYDLSLRGMYPKRLYATAARCLVALYPQLKDSSDSGHFSWFLSLKNKFKNLRKRMPPGCPEVDAQKAKRARKPLADVSNQANQQPFCHETAVAPVFEMDEVFVTEAINFMKKELSTRNPNMEKVKDAMDKTCKARRKCLEGDKMSVKEFVALYPALTLEREMSEESVPSFCCHSF